MAAHVEHRFKKGFLLDEEKLRKLVNIISQRLSKSDPPIAHKFHVFRADSYAYETNNVEDVINEDNADWRRISRLQIEASHEKEFEFDLMFSDEGTSLKLNGDDRDKVYLVLSDVREYLKNEVNTCVHISSRVCHLIMFMLPLTLMLVALCIVMIWKVGDSHVSEAEIQTVLDSQQIEEKLDFLIKCKKVPDEAILAILPLIVIFPALMFFAITGFVDKIRLFFCPSNLFLFGPQKQKYERRRRIMAKVIWGILIAFVISALGSLAVWKLTT